MAKSKSKANPPQAQSTGQSTSQKTKKDDAKISTEAQTTSLNKSASQKARKDDVKPDTAVQTTGSAKNTIFFWKDDEKPYGFLCQWYKCKFTDPESGIAFNCAEQWMMWNKPKMCKDEAKAAEILNCTSPRKQKGLGREVTGFNQETWDKIQSDVVERGNYLKFTQGTDISSITINDKAGREPVPLRKLLRDTGDRELAEASSFDKVWGIGFSADQALREPRAKWGQNLLGQALMNVRRQIREEE